MASSGNYVDSYPDTRYCEVESIEGVDCTFYGEVEVFFDPETETEWWDCPLCNYGHVSGMEEYDDE